MLLGGLVQLLRRADAAPRKETVDGSSECGEKRMDKNSENLLQGFPEAVESFTVYMVSDKGPAEIIEVTLHKGTVPASVERPARKKSGFWRISSTWPPAIPPLAGKCGSTV